MTVYTRRPSGATSARYLAASGLPRPPPAPSANRSPDVPSANRRAERQRGRGWLRNATYFDVARGRRVGAMMGRC